MTTRLPSPGRFGRAAVASARAVMLATRSSVRAPVRFACEAEPCHRKRSGWRAIRMALGLALALGYWSALPRAALAFSDSVSFSLPPTAAGGGNRYFTGSPADGYTCKVCHSGGPAPALRVLGLPPMGYGAGVSYEIVVDWSDTIDKFSAAFEFTDAEGNVAGSVRLPPDDELLPAEFCEPSSAGVPAASLADAPNGRQVVSLPDCGAKQMRVLWTAPKDGRALGSVWFAGSAVVSNGEGDPGGDGVTDFGRVIGPLATGSPLASYTSAGCNAVPSSSRSACAWVFSLSALLVGSCRRRVRRRAALARWQAARAQ
jgi:hypothetical protein